MSNQIALYSVIARIPFGKVATYGQIANLTGIPRGARAVGMTLKRLPADTTLPWHRVINAKGEISLPPASSSFALQIQKLEREGVRVIKGKISLAEFQWRP